MEILGMFIGGCSFRCVSVSLSLFLLFFTSGVECLFVCWGVTIFLFIASVLVFVLLLLTLLVLSVLSFVDFFVIAIFYRFLIID